MSAKQAINDKLQGSVATYLRCGEVVNNQIKKGLLLSLLVNKNLKSEDIWQSYKQERDCLMHFARLARTLLKDEESARDNHARQQSVDRIPGRDVLADWRPSPRATTLWAPPFFTGPTVNWNGLPVHQQHPPASTASTAAAAAM